MRIQNDGSLVPLQQEMPLNDISSLLMYNREIEEHILSFLPEDSEEGSEEGVGGDEESDLEDEEDDTLDKSQEELDKDRLMVNFPRPEMGMSPDPGESSFPHNLGSDKSCPTLEISNEVESAEEHERNLEFECHISTFVGEGLPEEFSQRPSSFKDVSDLEKRYSKELEDVGAPKDKDGEGKDDPVRWSEKFGEKITADKEDKKDTEKQGVIAVKLGGKIGRFCDSTDGRKETKDREKTAIVKPSVLPLEKRSGGVLRGPNTTTKLTQPRLRQRGHTFSAISKSSRQIERKAEELKTRKTSESRSGSRDAMKSGVDPSFVFLQLFFSPFVVEDTERPIAIPFSQMAQRAVKVLDRIPPYDTHKIGVLYVGPNQAENEIAILSNVYGSSRYMSFLKGLGKLIPLQEAGHIEIYTGGLDTSGSDGKFVYWWKDDVMQVIFHVATLMPNKESDPNCTAKKLHIGNDFVSIVYNESGSKYHLGTIKGQFNFAEIIIEPLDKETNLVMIQTKPAKGTYAVRLACVRVCVCVRL
ncbi:putative tuberin [Apostichopus japonicus]|uniref:Putative tuberin n=1 Tax=Stichopus japonicus TaxID=307972 RepID=A0A2G8KD44_STIJA|nr:putative tuberin [Apostichopus japonicus]